MKSDDGRAKLYADIAHPINSDCRETIQEQVLIAYVSELERSKQPGYICIYDDYGEDNFAQLCDDELSGPDLSRLHRHDGAEICHPTPHVNVSEASPNSFAVAQRNGHDDEEKFGVGII